MIRNFFGHLHTINKHRFKVFILCSKCGFKWRGLVHDLSKYSPTEFFEGVKYYAGGKKSPIINCKNDIGYSKAWLHHKGRNKHHSEYWLDLATKTKAPIIPFNYSVEMICDNAFEKCDALSIFTFDERDTDITISKSAFLMYLYGLFASPKKKT